VQELQDHLDPDTLQELRGVLGADFPLLVTTFVTDSESRLAAIRAALAAGDAPAVREAAHALKGSSLNIGAHRLAAACVAVEAFARAGDAAGIAGQLPGLESAFRAVCANLTRWAAR
jgi:histidine phosphotransfer protein HptB